MVLRDNEMADNETLRECSDLFVQQEMRTILQNSAMESDAPFPPEAVSGMSLPQCSLNVP
jgi:hypothetical protein